jgi:N-acetyl-anhydromuramyl-L-alanine amidase AmpD
MSAEYPGASWAPIPGFGYDPRGSHGREGHAPKWIILHGTASGDGTAEQQARWFQGQRDHGVHFVIGKNGQVIQMVSLADAAYGNGILGAKHDAF